MVTFGSVLSPALHVCAANHKTTRLFPNVSHLVTSLLLVQTYCVLDLDYFRSLFPGFLPLICSPCSCPIQCHHLRLPQTSFYMSFILMLKNLQRYFQLLFKNLMVKAAECSPRTECSVCTVLLRPYCRPRGVTPVLSQF